MGKTYLFHVAIPRSGRTWRKIEMRGDHTLEDLHHVIQDAFEFDDDHLYSFFMSGKAWDKDSEYTLPERVSPYGQLFIEGEEIADDEADESEMPNLDDFLLEYLEGLNIDDEATAELLPQIKDYIEARQDPGVPLAERLAALIGRDVPSVMILLILIRRNWEDWERDEQRDVRKVTIESLELTVGKKFLYLFDYGDEWRFNVRLDAIHETDQPDAFPKIVQMVGKPPPQYPESSEEDEDWGEEDDDGGFVIYGDDDEK